MPRLIITFPPRHGKSELSSRRFPSWFVGRDPYRHLMVATYNQHFAEDFGRDVRSILNSKPYQQIFPNVHFRTGSQAADRPIGHASWRERVCKEVWLSVVA